MYRDLTYRGIAAPYNALVFDNDKVVEVTLSQEVREELHESHTDGKTLWGATLNIQPVGREVTLFGRTGSVVKVTV